MKKNRFVNGLILWCLIIAFGCGSYFAYEWWFARLEQKEIVALADTVVVEKKADRTDGQVYDPLFDEVDFDALVGNNPDATRWIKLPNTNVNQPVMQEQTVGSYYYLHKDINKKYKLAGSLFTPAIPDGTENGSLLVFGHWMGKKTYGDYMFSMLKERFGDRRAIANHPYVYVYEQGVSKRYRVYGGKRATVEDIAYTLPRPLGSTLYEDVIKYWDDNLDWKDEVLTLTQFTPTLVMSTCDAIADDRRFYAVFVLDKVLDKTTGQIYSGNEWTKDLEQKTNQEIMRKVFGNE